VCFGKDGGNPYASIFSQPSVVTKGVGDKMSIWIAACQVTENLEARNRMAETARVISPYQLLHICQEWTRVDPVTSLHCHMWPVRQGDSPPLLSLLAFSNIEAESY
jgi:hypothetical protein